MYILGIHGNFGRAEHDASAVIIKDDKIIAAAEEERFTRHKHATGLMPDKAIQFCLDAADISMEQVDVVAFPRGSWKDFDERLKAYLWYNFGHIPPIQYVDHHLSHAASTYYISGFSSSIILTLDQAGDGISCGIFRGNGNNLNLVKTILFPDSIGLFAAFITQYLGFRSNHDEYKVMGLAAYGTPSIDLSKIFTYEAGDIKFNTDLLHAEALKRYPIFHTDQLPMFKDKIYTNLPPRRKNNDPILEEHKNLAASAQRVIEESIFALIHKFKNDGDTHLCIAGGVGENSVANGRLAQSGIFQDIYVAPACGDAGTALGAALHVATQKGYCFDRVIDNKWGPDYSDLYIEKVLKKYKIPYAKSNDISLEVSRLLVEQKIIAFFNGKMEFGSRALGSRSLIADPSHELMKKRVNNIKKREQFRPFSPSVLEEHASELFISSQKSPFMSFTLDTTAIGKQKLVAATHVDFSGRLQTVPKGKSVYRKIIEHFHSMTGVPAILNTSLNSGWEPIVESPEQALAFFFSSEADILVLNNCIVSKDRK